MAGDRQCAEHEYFDEVVSRCFHCFDICNPARGTESECRRQCPDDYLDYFRSSTNHPPAATTPVVTTSSVLGSGEVVVIVLALILILLIVLLGTLILIKYKARFRKRQSGTRKMPSFMRRWRRDKGRDMIMETDPTASLTIGAQDEQRSPRSLSTLQSGRPTPLASFTTCSLEQKCSSDLSSARGLSSRTMSTQTEPLLISVLEEDHNASSICANCSSSAVVYVKSRDGNETRTTGVRGNNSHCQNQLRAVSVVPGPNIKTRNHVETFSDADDCFYVSGIKSTGNPNISRTNSREEHDNVASLSIASAHAAAKVGGRERGQSHQRWTTKAPAADGHRDDRSLRTADDEEITSLPSAPESLSLERPLLGLSAYPHPSSSPMPETKSSDSHQYQEVICRTPQKTNSRTIDVGSGYIVEMPGNCAQAALEEWRLTHETHQDKISSPDQSEAFSLSREVNGVSLRQIEKQLEGICPNTVDDIELGLMMKDMEFDGNASQSPYGYN